MAGWKGGKARLAKRLLPLFPPHRIYVEPFGGMASVLLNKPPVETEVYNDCDERLVGLFAVIKYHPEEFDRELAGLLKSRRLFELYKGQTGITDIQRAARFLYTLALGYGGKGEHFGTAVHGGGSSLLSADRMLAMAGRIRHRLQTVSIEWLDWERCIEKYDSRETFFFCDPPYWGTEGYAVPFSERDQVVLAGRLMRIKGKFLMTNIDCRKIQDLYRGCRISVLRGSLGLPAGHARKQGLNHLVVMNYGPLKAGSKAREATLKRP